MHSNFRRLNPIAVFSVDIGPSVSLLRSAKKTGQDPRKQLSFNGLP